MDTWMGRMKPQLLLRVPGCVKDTAFELALSDPSVVPSFKWVGHNGYQGLLQPCFSPRSTLVPFISVFLFDHGQHTQPRSASASFSVKQEEMSSKAPSKPEAPVSFWSSRRTWKPQDVSHRDLAELWVLQVYLSRFPGAILEGTQCVTWTNL